MQVVTLWPAIVVPMRPVDSLMLVRTASRQQLAQPARLFQEIAGDAGGCGTPRHPFAQERSILTVSAALSIAGQISRPRGPFCSDLFAKSQMRWIVLSFFLLVDVRLEEQLHRVDAHPPHGGIRGMVS